MTHSRHGRYVWPVRVAASALLFLLLAAGWNVWSLKAHLEQLRSEAITLRSALLAHDATAGQAALTGFKLAAGAAAGRAHWPTWWLLERLPIVGDDAQALTAIADTSKDLSTRALPGLVDAASGDVWSDLAPHNSRIDPRAVRQFGPLVNQASVAFAAANHRLAAVDRSALLSQTRPSFVTFADQIDNVAALLSSTSRAVKVLPTMLGEGSPRRYLLAFNNNAEVRATGGLPGATAVVSARQGAIKLVDQGAAVDLGQFPAPVLPQSPTENALYGVQPTVFFGDTNFVPDYPRTAQVMRAMWKEHYGDTVDGTISMDVVTMSYLLRATGPLDVDGVHLTPENAVAELVNGVYLRIADPEKQNEFFRHVAKQIFARVTAGVEPTALVEAVTQGVTEGRVLVHSFHDDEQSVLDPTTISGRMDYTTSGTPRLGVYLQDATGSKMSYYLRRKVTLEPVHCSAQGQQVYAASARFTSTAPPRAAKLPTAITGGGAFGTPPGQQLVLGKVYGSSGGNLTQFAFDGKPVDVQVIVDRGRPVATPVLQLKPGQSTTVTWRVTSGPGQPGRAALTVTPGLDPEPATRWVPSAC